MKLMLLEAAADATPNLPTPPDTSGWPWYGQLIAFAVAGLFALAMAYGIFRTRAISKANDKAAGVDSSAGNPVGAVLLAALLSLPLTGCFEFLSPSRLDEASAAANADDWRFGWKVVEKYHDRANATPEERSIDKDFWDAGIARADAMHARTQEQKGGGSGEP